MSGCRFYLPVAFMLLIAAHAYGADVPSSQPAPDLAQMEKWWDDLKGGDTPATLALLNFADHPSDAVEFLKPRMKPLTLSPAHARELIEKLSNDDVDVWKPAFEELQYYDPRLAIDLQTLWNETPDPPGRTRLAELLSGRSPGSMEGQSIELRSIGGGEFNFSSKNASWWAEGKIERLGSGGWDMGNPGWIRDVRAIALLQHIATPDAIAILKDMATGHPDAKPTKSAKEALESLKK